MSNKKSLIDTIPFRAQLVESVNGKSGVVRVRGMFQKADKENKNGRVYPKSLWESLLNQTSLKESISRRRMLGEADHPDEGETKIKRVSHVVTKLWMTPNGDVMGEAEVLDTPDGRIIQELLAKKVEIGISSRGMGSTSRKNGKEVVEEDFELTTFDFVVDPSTHDAYPQAITESRKLTNPPKGNKEPMDIREIQEKVAKVLALKPSLLTVEGRRDAIKEIDTLMIEVSKASSTDASYRLLARETASKLGKKKSALEAKAPGVDKLLVASKELVTELAKRLKAEKATNRKLAAENALLQKKHKAGVALLGEMTKQGSAGKVTSPVPQSKNKFIEGYLDKNPALRPYTKQLEEAASKGKEEFTQAVKQVNAHLARRKAMQEGKNQASPGVRPQLPPRNFRSPAPTPGALAEGVRKVTQPLNQNSSAMSRVNEINSRNGFRY